MKAKKQNKKEQLSNKEINEFFNLSEDVDDVIDAGLINLDPGACPNCGGDLDDGDHTYCSRF